MSDKPEVIVHNLESGDLTLQSRPCLTLTLAHFTAKFPAIFTLT